MCPARRFSMRRRTKGRLPECTRSVKSESDVAGADEERNTVTVSRPAWIITVSAFTIFLGAAVTAVGVFDDRDRQQLEDIVDLKARVLFLENQANKGERFTARDGAALESRVGALELWRDDHTKFGWEKTLEWNHRVNEVERMCRENCK